MQHFLYDFESSRPSIARDAWIAPSAVIIGNVTIGGKSSVWFHTVIRGDTNFVLIGERTNIQDGTIIHVDPGDMSTSIGNDVTIGHACVIHGCRILDGAFVGMKATVMNGAIIEGGGVLAAGAILTSDKRICSGELWAGTPAKLLRYMSLDEQLKFAANAGHYVKNAERFGRALRHTQGGG